MKRSKCDLEVGRVGLQVVERTGDAGLELGRVLARWARGRDLVEGTHDCGVLVEREVQFVPDQKSLGCAQSLGLGQFDYHT